MPEASWSPEVGFERKGGARERIGYWPKWTMKRSGLCDDAADVKYGMLGMEYPLKEQR